MHRPISYVNCSTRLTLLSSCWGTCEHECIKIHLINFTGLMRGDLRTEQCKDWFYYHDQTIESCFPFSLLGRRGHERSGTIVLHNYYLFTIIYPILRNDSYKWSAEKYYKDQRQNNQANPKPRLHPAQS